jgi:Arc/MetJ-type ribon-helix-helix transcriptional regulator
MKSKGDSTMPTGEPMTITLPPELSDRVRAKMAENGYADALEVVEDGLLAERASPSEIEEWLREEIIPYCAEIDRDPTKLRTVAQIDAMLEAEFQRALEAE